MDIRSLRTFVAAFEEGNFTKAAHRLHATQPGVSVQIAALEAHVGATLFDRGVRCVTATAAAHRLYPRALKLISDFNGTVQEIRALGGAVTGRAAVGIPPTLSSGLIPSVLCRYVNAYPHSDIRIVEDHCDALLSQIERHELDFALVTHVSDRSAMVERQVCEDYVVSAFGPLGGIDSTRPVRLDGEERRFKIVVPSMLRHALSGKLAAPFRAGQIVAERLIELDGLESALKFVAETDWVALLPASACCRSAKSADVRFAQIAGDQITIKYSIVHAGTEPPSTAAQAFIDLAVAELARIGTQWGSRMLSRSRRPGSLQSVGLKRAQIDWKSPVATQGTA